MLIAPRLQLFSIGLSQVALFVPEESAVKQYYQTNKENAYWAKVWPAAIGLCLFLNDHPEYIAGKSVLELAAGLGLPGLYAASLAGEVSITDREPLAIAYIKASAINQNKSNIRTAALNWVDATTLPDSPDVLLLSDVNYDMDIFEELKKVVRFFLRKKCTVIISTPQRLVAKTFINSWLPHCSKQWNCNVDHDEAATGVSVFVLEMDHDG